MCRKSYSKLYKDVKKEDIWDLWADAGNWIKWHTGLDYCKLEGDFKTGNYLILKQRGVGIVKLFLTEVEKEKKFTASANFFGAKIHYTRAMEEKPEGLMVTYTMHITGLLKWWWYLIMKSKLVDCMPHDVDKLVEVARKHHK